MRRKKRKFSPYATQHIYLRCRDLGVLFYSIQDRLVYYTLAATHSRKKRVRIVAASFMFTHIHQSADAPTKQDLECYLRNTDSAYSRLYNAYHGRKEGQLFDKPPGRSQKFSYKDKKTNLIYVFNNHVEKGLCRKAIQERWSFLAYAFSDHPFSEKIDLKTASRTLCRALRLVDRRVGKNKALEYADLDRIMPLLDAVETEQFIDYVISRYALIDFSAAVSLFESAEDMVRAVNSTTGGEYDISEDYSVMKDTPYVELTEFFSRNGMLGRIFTMSPGEKMDCMMAAKRYTDASDEHLKRFFHIDCHLSR